LSDVRVRTAGGQPLTDLPLDLLVTALAAVALGGCGIWLAAVTLATAYEVVTGTSSAVLRAVSPHLVRRLVAACCGLAVGGAGSLAPASGTPHETAEGASPTSSPSGSDVLTGLPLPDRVLGSAPRRPTSTAPLRARGVHPGYAGDTVVMASAAGQLRRRTPTTYEVRAGDCLWTIAEDLLPAASADEVDQAWRRIHHANRDAVGPNPDLVLPGTTLRLPEPLTGPAGSRGPDAPGSHPHRKDAS
jgi:nucleoid-associated protein YgaU